MNELEQVKQRIQALEDRLAVLDRTSSFTMYKTLQMLDGRNVQTGKDNGTILATEATQKLGFWGTTPYAQLAAPSNPSGGTTVDSEARTALISLLNKLKLYGLLG